MERCDTERGGSRQGPDIREGVGVACGNVGPPEFFSCLAGCGEGDYGAVGVAGEAELGEGTGGGKGEV